MADLLYLTNDPPLQSSPEKKALLAEALKHIVEGYPPQDAYTGICKGLWRGPTGIAYLFLHVSSAYPDLEIEGRTASAWANAYIEGKRDADQMSLIPGKSCGLTCEALCYKAVRASITKDLSVVQSFIESIPEILEGDFPAELLGGKAGVLYYLRMMRTWVPESASIIAEPVRLIQESIMREGTQWEFHERRYLGAVHGDIGIVTQLVLTSPTIAPQLEAKLDQLLGLQQSNGNWTVIEDPSRGLPYVQFCHGAPGFLFSLYAIQPYFPSRREEIAKAISLATELVWKEGILKKEPNLCHGVLGNSLVMPKGERRDHFLAVGSPINVQKVREQDPKMFELANYGDEFAPLVAFWPGTAWACLVGDRVNAPIIAYNDV
ncbi:hypothetical protein BX600DRAFT_512873 [Xylariales sp. PMI_506]|nr:hypothetical protein BX600DRAFT_512873 [Xylariales sp. PMI_506]